MSPFYLRNSGGLQPLKIKPEPAPTKPLSWLPTTAFTVTNSRLHSRISHLPLRLTRASIPAPRPCLPPRSPIPDPRYPILDPRSSNLFHLLILSPSQRRGLVMRQERE